MASFFTVAYLLISNAWVTQIRQSMQLLGELFLYMHHSQGSNDQETEAAFPSPRSSHRAVREIVSITIDRNKKRSRFQMWEMSKKTKKGKRRREA